MKIAKIELFKVPPRWLFLKITTDDGIEGWGEPVVEGKASTVKAAVEEMASYIIGRDAHQIEDIWQVLYQGRILSGRSHPDERYLRYRPGIMGYQRQGTGCTRLRAFGRSCCVIKCKFMAG